MDENGCIPFYRYQTGRELADEVVLDVSRFTKEGMARLKAYYDWYQEKGVTVYVDFACINMDAVPEDQKNNASVVSKSFREAIEAMEGPVMLGRLENYLYRQGDFFDTNYHLLSYPAELNTRQWMTDLKGALG